ncbi:unnamed protein product [Diatraea saccharalis]|uniref:t-SNARE coiled-coil homology domain-containing protein n=1 Tax=Diatraea saccharalis TaxID=40085 RepID=A0A9N9R3A9_9NEOP|nr:unnamed protein product [Diatraea saccharalis]
MATLIQSYEQQYSVLTADITAKIGRLKSSNEDNIDNDEVFDDWSGGANEQRQKLLDNTERLERTGKNISEGYRLAVETEQVGAAVLHELSAQRETIQRARGRIRETDEQLTRSGRVVGRLMSRALQQRAALALGALLLAALAAAGLYRAVS